MSEPKSEPTLEDVAAETLSGDLRDTMLTHIRSMETPWSKLSERQQEDKIYAIQNACEHIVRQAVRIIASAGNEVIEAEVTKFTVKDTIKMEVTANVTTPNIERLADNRGRHALLLFVSASDYLGQRAPADADKDEPALPLSEDEAA